LLLAFQLLALSLLAVVRRLRLLGRTRVLGSSQSGCSSKPSPIPIANRTGKIINAKRKGDVGSGNLKLVPKKKKKIVEVRSSMRSEE
jgi:hypothetical protein